MCYVLNRLRLQHHLFTFKSLVMFLKTSCFILLLFVSTYPSFSQDNQETTYEDYSVRPFRLSSTVLSFTNIGEGDKKTNTHHYELHAKYQLSSKDIIGLKLTTWRLFQPMGIVWWDGLLDKLESQSEFYPGFLRETGFGVSYQRMLWKDLFATIEVLPQLKTYLDENKSKIGNGFKLYISYHIGYHIPLFKKKQFFLEPQIHCQNWMIDTNTPSEFKALDDKWRNYFLFEPNIYFGLKF